ncbi:hypothetical protein EVAR_19760_1 [Eumeta japonica]|uniref:Uncharacterized protein n=1 Tax=Eumeta variegata TaxID=151549 RepID=A0A4C1UQX3_EUMVA|nr:hypothetical protein EVAR_19760_1 [Eumeta japonica]
MSELRVLSQPQCNYHCTTAAVNCHSVLQPGVGATTYRERKLPTSGRVEWARHATPDSLVQFKAISFFAEATFVMKLRPPHASRRERLLRRSKAKIEKDKFSQITLILSLVGKWAASEATPARRVTPHKGAG